jgi:hypothetical protein
VLSVSQATSATATDAATATEVPTVTVTATTANTATPVPTSGPTQAQVDREASNSFTAVSLDTAPDGSCAASGSNSFPSGQKIYINLCTSGSVASSSLTVSIRQLGDVCTLHSVAANSSYNCYTTNSGLTPPNRYDMVVTMRISGKTATARDLPFTITL